jgi:hypothetical protein
MIRLRAGKLRRAALARRQQPVQVQHDGGWAYRVGVPAPQQKSFGATVEMMQARSTIAMRTPFTDRRLS